MLVAVRRVIELLDRSPTRPLLALALRARIRQLHGVWVAVRYDRARRLWVLRWPEAIVPTLEPAPTSPREFELAHADVFFQEYTPRDGDVIVDFGAGMGSELGLLTRCVGPRGHVFAIEADPRTYDCLARRVELNRLVNVTPIHAAVGDRRTEVVISQAGHHLGHRVTEDGQGARVACLPFDDLAREYGIARVDLLKINIEGAEAAALAGMRQTLPLVRNVAVSCHDFTGQATEASVREMLQDNGFRIHARRTDDARPWARSWIYGTRDQAGI
jgi:FkbM family methyltransferase